jgi:hypothetical protein
MVAAAAVGTGAAQASPLILCGWDGCELFILGPRTPNPRSSPHMSFRMHPSKVKAGGTLRGTARGFLAHEYVTIWDYYGKRWRHSSELNGGWSSGRGTLSFIRETFATNITPLGEHKICLQGERSHRVACATYRVLSAGPAVGPGFVPPTTSGYTPPTVGPGYVPPGSA